MTKMVRCLLVVVAGAVGLAALSATDAVAGVNVASHDRPFDYVFDSGQACAGFALGLWIDGGDHLVSKTFTDAHGNVVRTLSAGRGYDLTFADAADRDHQVSLRGNGSVQQKTINADGSSTITMMGHTVVFLYPTDITPGPSSTLYVGRVVMTNTAAQESTIVSWSGTKFDICDAVVKSAATQA